MISFVQSAALIAEVSVRIAWTHYCRSLIEISQLGATFDIDAFVEQIDKAGPIVPRLVTSGAIQEPLFAVISDIILQFRVHADFLAR